MKRLTAISTLLVSFAGLMVIPAFAQHGGGHAGGGGFSGHAGGSGFGGGIHSAPSGFAPRSGFAGARPTNPQPGYGFQNRVGVAPRTLQRPGMQMSVGGARGSQFRQPYRSPDQATRDRWKRGGVIYENSRGRRGGYRTGYVLPYFRGSPFGLGYYGDDSYYGYDDSLNYDPSQGYDQGPAYYGPDQYNGFDPQAAGPDQGQMQYQIQGQDPSQNGFEDQAQVQGPEPGQYPNQIPPGAPYQPYYGSPDRAPNSKPARRPIYRQNSPAKDQPAVTLVFSDHRPNQVIHNYLINGGTLTVWDQSAHDIPVEDLDIEATRKINRDKGVDFLLPNAKL